MLSMDKSMNEMTRARSALLIAALVAVLWAGTAHARQSNSNSTGSQKDTPDTPHLEFVFEEFVTLGASIHPGETPFGERNIVPITGGTFSGPNIRGKVLSGGWDWQLVSLANAARSGSTPGPHPKMRPASAPRDTALVWYSFP
jgi:Protein of unknown function (DUF3237)